MFSNEYGEAAVEVLDILDNKNSKDLEKIPSSFIKFLVDNASENYRVNFEHSKTMEQLELKEKTKEILGVIYINWWCNKKDKANYIKQIEEQERERQNELRKKYDPNNIFKNKNKLQEYDKIATDENMQNKTTKMIEYKESVLKKICQKILNFWKK